MTDGIISFIGGGNMATSLIGGLIADGRDPASIYVSDPDSEKLEALADVFRVQTSSDNEEAVRLASAVVFAVKPQTMAPVVTGVAVAGNMGVMFAGCTPFRQQGSGTASSDIQMPKWPFNYKKIDPEKAARLGYEFYKEGG